jgi:hypothetical protein
MSGSLQARVYGSSGKISSTMKTLGSYNKAPMRRMGHTNGTIKKLGVYNGTTTGKSNLHQEIYPRY